jgi:hypothetical protein
MNADSAPELPAPPSGGRASLLAAAFLVCLAGGCASGTVYPDFHELKPQSIAVLPVNNATLHPLDAVTFVGIVSETILGAPRYDIPEILRGALEEHLLLAGYDLAPAPAGTGMAATDFRKPLPAGSPAPAFDAVVYPTIVAWRSGRGSPGFDMRYRLEMHAVPGGRLLYDGEFVCSQRSDTRSWGGETVTNSIRRSAEQSLASLPPGARKAPPAHAHATAAAAPSP